MSWIARLAVRRVVWIVVGLVVFALLGAVGVKAASARYQESDAGFGYAGHTESGWAGSGYTPEGTCTLLWNDGSRGTATFTVHGGGDVVVRNAAITQPFDVTIDGDPAAQAYPGTTTYEDVAPGAVIVLRGNQASDVSCLDWVEYDQDEPTPTATPTATPTPTPDPMCDPYCEVALVQEDRDRLDLLAIVLAGGFTVLVFVGAVGAGAGAFRA